MSTQAKAHLGGGLANHARGRTLAATFHAEPVSTLPAAGALFVLGKEFQGGGEAQDAWLEWASTPGRVLVVVPPFGRGYCDKPARWEAKAADPLAGGETALGKVLARERRHEIRGQLLPLERTAGQVVTAGWRKHPAAGLVVISALPVWSLSALDHTGACDVWLADLVEQAGKPPEPAAISQGATAKPAERVLTQDEWTFLLHLCTGPFPSEGAALESLARSAIHHLPVETANSAMQGLTALGLAESGALTDQGECALREGPYAAYARALRRQA